jgi:hypothetical protein
MSSARRKRKDKQFKKAMQNGTARNQQNRKFQPVPRIVQSIDFSIITKLFSEIFGGKL